MQSQYCSTGVKQPKTIVENQETSINLQTTQNAVATSYLSKPISSTKYRMLEQDKPQRGDGR